MLAALLPLGILAVVILHAAAERGARRLACGDRAHSHLIEVIVLGALVGTAMSAVISYRTPTPAEHFVDAKNQDQAASALSLLAVETGGRDALAKMVTDLVNGRGGKVQARLDAYLEGLDYSLYVKNADDYFPLIEEPWRPQGPRVEASHLFLGEWSYAFAVPGLNVTTGREGLDVDALLLAYGDHKRLPGGDVMFELQTQADGRMSRPFTWRTVAVSDAGYPTGASSTRIRIDPVGGTGENTWAWALDPQDPRSGQRFDVVVQGYVPADARLSIFPPPGWGFTEEVALRTGWILESTSPAWTFRSLGTAAQPSVRLTAAPGNNPVTDTFQIVHAVLTGGPPARAAFVLPYPGIDAMLDQDVIANTPHPWRSGEANRMTVAYLNGGDTRYLHEIRVVAPPGLFDPGVDVTVKVKHEADTDPVLTGRFSAEGVLEIPLAPPLRLRHPGEPYTVPDPAAPMVRLPRVASGITTLLIDATPYPASDPRAVGAGQRMAAELIFANGHRANLTDYGPFPGVFHGVVLPESASGKKDGYARPYPSGFPVATHPPTDYTTRVASGFLPTWMNGTLGYRVVHDATGLLSPQLVAYRDAYREGALVLNRTTLPVGADLLIKTDLEALLLQLALRGATDIRHTVSIYSPPTMGEKPDTLLETRENLVNLRRPIEVVLLADVNVGPGAEVVVATGDLLLAYESGGSLLWKRDLPAPIQAVHPWRPPGSVFDKLAVAYGDGVALVAADGTLEWTRSGAAVRRVASGTYHDLPALAVADIDMVRFLKTDGTEIGRTAVQGLGIPTVLVWSDRILVGGEGGGFGILPGALELLVWQPDTVETAHDLASPVAISGRARDILVSTGEVTRQLGGCGGRACHVWALEHPGAVVAHAGDGTGGLFIVTPDGLVRILDPGNGQGTTLQLTGAGATPPGQQVNRVVHDADACYYLDAATQDRYDAHELSAGPLTIGREAGAPATCQESDVASFLEDSVPDGREGFILYTAAVVPCSGSERYALAYLHIDGQVRIAAFDRATRTQVWEHGVGLTFGDAITTLTGNGQDVYAATLSGNLVRIPGACGQMGIPSTWSPNLLLGQYFHTFRAPRGGFYGAYAVVSSLSWYDPILGDRIAANLLGTFQVVRPDGSAGGPTYTLTLEAWLPESAHDHRWCPNLDENGDGVVDRKPWFCPPAE